MVDGAADEALLISARLARIEKGFESILKGVWREEEEEEG